MQRVVLQTAKKKWSKTAHETWQLDGKEQIMLGNGEEVSWMNIADEGTSAHLKAVLNSTRTVAAICPETATHIVNSCFEYWGLPINIKIDNGRPFVNPNARDVPTLTKLWWIGLGIKVIQNAPRCPQQNGIVESLQGTMCSWSNPGGQPDMKSLQQRLNEESEFQRNHYRIPAKKHKTRIELHPDLEQNPRRYHPELFDINRVYEYLSNKVWTRAIKNNGDVSFFGQHIYVGKKYARFDVTIIFDPQEKCWRFSKEDGTLLKTSSKAVPDEHEIKRFAMMSKNSDTTLCQFDKT